MNVEPPIVAIPAIPSSGRLRVSAADVLTGFSGFSGLSATAPYTFF